jgi:hypothetical protein
MRLELTSSRNISGPITVGVESVLGVSAIMVRALAISFHI